MTYWNPVERYGVERFAADLAAAGGAGLITPDLVPDEAEAWVAAADEHDLDKVFLVAPSSTDARLARTAAACRGFVYATAVMGVTGARESTSELVGPLVTRTKAVTDLPVGGRTGRLQRRPGGRGGPARRRRDRGLGLRAACCWTRPTVPRVWRRWPSSPATSRGACDVRSGIVAVSLATALGPVGLLGRDRRRPPSGPVSGVTIVDDDGLHGAVLPEPYDAPDVALSDTEGGPYRLDRGPPRPVTTSRWSSSATRTAPTSATW